MSLSAAGLRRRYYRCYASCWLLGSGLFGLGAALLGSAVYYYALEQRFPTGGAGVVALLLARGGVSLLAWGVRAAERQVRLVRDGAVALGWITEVKVIQAQRSRLDAFLFTACGSRPIRTYYQPRYAFKDARGREHAGEGLVSRTRRWQRGDPVLVAYDPDRPERHDLDWFGFRTEELNPLLDRAR